MTISIYFCVCEGAYESQKWALDLLLLEVQEVLNCGIWVPGTKPWTFGRTVSMSLAPAWTVSFFNILQEIDKDKGKSIFHDFQASVVGRHRHTWDAVPQMRHKTSTEI